MIKQLELALVLITVIGGAITGFLFMDNRHLEQFKEFELRAELIDIDIKKDAELISYYEDKKLSMEGLSLAEDSRFRYIEKELERKIAKKELIEQKLMEF